MNFLITGGAGFIGSNCVEMLLYYGHKVRVVDNFSTGRIENLAEFIDKIQLINAPLEDFQIARQAVEGIDYIIHLAAIPSVQFSIDDPLRSSESMVSSSISLFKAATEYGGIKGIVQAASAAAYGNNPVLPKKEDMFPEPLSPYAVSKLTQEYYGRVYNYLHGLKVTSLRFFNIYGPKQNPKSSYSGVISIFLSEMLNGKRPLIYGDGSNSRDFVYVDDAVDSIIKACFTERETSEIINIGTGIATSLNSLVKIINNIIGKDLQPEYMPCRQGDILHSLADISKGKSLLAYMPKYNITEGMTKLVDYMTRGKP